MTNLNSALQPDDGLSARILRAAFDGATRPEDFEGRLGLEAGSLETSLEALVDAGFLERRTSRRNRDLRQYRLIDRGECYRNVLSAFARAVKGETP